MIDTLDITSAPVASTVVVGSNPPADEEGVVLVLVLILDLEPHLVGSGLLRSTEGDTKTLTAAVDSPIA